MTRKKAPSEATFTDKLSDFVEAPSPSTGEGGGEGEAPPPPSYEVWIRGEGIAVKGALHDAIGRKDCAAPEDGTLHVASLDADNVFWGPVTKHMDDLEDHDVLVPATIDLAHGRYKLNRDPSRIGGPGFDPLERSQRKTAPTAPTFEEALHALIRGDKAKAEAWAEHYEKTLDAKKK